MRSRPPKPLESTWVVLPSLPVGTPLATGPPPPPNPPLPAVASAAGWALPPLPGRRWRTAHRCRPCRRCAAIGGRSVQCRHSIEPPLPAGPPLMRDAALAAVTAGTGGGCLTPGPAVATPPSPPFALFNGLLPETEGEGAPASAAGAGFAVALGGRRNRQTRPTHRYREHDLNCPDRRTRRSRHH